MYPTVKLSIRTRSQSRNEGGEGEETEQKLDRVEEEPLQVPESPGDDFAQIPRTFSEDPWTGESSEDLSIEGDSSLQNSAVEGCQEEDAASVQDPTREVVQDQGDDMAEARGLTITPGKFKGGVEENVEEYLTQFERVARANGWNDNKKKVILPCYLEGAALKWYENIEGTLGENITWAQISEGMKETFQGIAWEEQVEYRLRMRMQGETEPVEAYVQDVLNLCQKVDHNMVERSRIKYVLRGLRPSLLEKVMVMTNDTLANLMENIRKIETARFMAGQRVDHLMTELPRGNVAGLTTGPIEGGAITRTLESKLDNLTSEFAKLGMRLLEQQRQQQTPRTAGNGGRPTQEGQASVRGPPRRGPPEGWSRGRGSYRDMGRGRTADGRVICYQCNRPGHYAVACRANQGNETGGH